MLMLLSFWAISLPLGYWVVARYFPKDHLSWEDLAILAFFVCIWPAVVVATFVDDDDD